MLTLAIGTSSLYLLSILTSRSRRNPHIRTAGIDLDAEALWRGTNGDVGGVQTLGLCIGKNSSNGSITSVETSALEDSRSALQLGCLDVWISHDVPLYGVGGGEGEEGESRKGGY